MQHYNCKYVLFALLVWSQDAHLVDDKNQTEVSVVAANRTTIRPPLAGFKSPCTCSKDQCGCCTGVILERFKQKACVNLTYDADDFAITAAMSMNDRVLYQNTVSGKNPPPLCVNVPRFRFIKFCVQFKNIYFTNQNVHLCVDAEASWEDFSLLEWSFDCVRMGLSGFAVVGPEEAGGFPQKPADQINQIDEDYDDSARADGDAPVSAKLLRNGNVFISIDKKHQRKLD